MPDADRTEADVDVGKPNPEQACPSPLLVSRVQAAHEVVDLVLYGVIGDAIEIPSDQVAEGMTSEYVTGKKNDVDHQNEASNSDSKPVGKEERP
jgi:hypothetical protein